MTKRQRGANKNPSRKLRVKKGSDRSPYVQRSGGDLGVLMISAIFFTAAFGASFMLKDRTPITRHSEPQASSSGPIVSSEALGSAEIIKANQFSICHTGGGYNCVVDGDTVWVEGKKIRISDIDAPETHPPRCEVERDLGERATLRLAAILNEGPFNLLVRGRETDRYGRMLRVIERDGVSIGDRLISEGLARPWEGKRRPWCG